MADKDKKPTDPVDPTTTVSPQPSIDPVYQAGRTVGGSDPSPARGYANVTTDLRSVIGGSQDANTARRGFLGYPKTLYHPTIGARTVEDPNGEAELPGPQHNWWPTPGEADMHRTDLEAQEVIHHARNWKNEVSTAMLEGAGDDLPVDKPEIGKGGVEEWPETNKPVRYSVQAEEVLKRGGVEPH
jgi:hypothetical protein